MPSNWCLYSYLLAGVAALFLLVLFRAQRWYLHAISVLVGLLAGVVPPFGGAGGDRFYLVAGITCVFLLTWGLGGPFFSRQPKPDASSEPRPARSRSENKAVMQL